MAMVLKQGHCYVMIFPQQCYVFSPPRLDFAGGLCAKKVGEKRISMALGCVDAVGRRRPKCCGKRILANEMVMYAKRNGSRHKGHGLEIR